LATQAGPLAQAEARKKVVEQEVEVERIKTLKEAEVATAEAEKREKELIATTIKPAEAEKIAAIARAEGEREAAIRRAEAEMRRLELEGQGKSAAIRAEGQAEADVIRMKLTAEAEGIEKRAKAFKTLDEAGRHLQVLEVVRHIVSESLEKLPPVMGEIAKPLGNVDRISLVDFGGNSPNGGSIARFGQTVPLVLTQLIEGLKAVGIDPADLVKLVKTPQSSSVQGVSQNL
jgi:flotillin